MSELKTNIIFTESGMKCDTCKHPTRCNYLLDGKNILCEECYLAQLPPVIQPTIVKKLSEGYHNFRILKEYDGYIVECDFGRELFPIVVNGKFHDLKDAEEWISSYLKSGTRFISV